MVSFMFVQFTVKNFMSFKNENVLDWSAVNAYKEYSDNLIFISNKEKFLKVMSIYGANASGKSNILMAFRFFRKIIRDSFSNANNESFEEINSNGVLKKYYQPYAFCKEKEDTEFELIFIIGDKEYQYGYCYNDQYINYEWLYQTSLETNRKKIIFERSSDNIELGSSIKKECHKYINEIDNDVLVLSFFNRLKLKNKLFNDVYNSIIKVLVFCDEFDDLYSYLLEDVLITFIDNEKDNLLQYLEAIESGISDIKYNKDRDKVSIYTYHKGLDNDEYKLDIDNESAGTVKSLALYALIKVVIASGQALFFDELNIKLHPLLLKFIIDMFNNSSTGAQLIYTTHDVTLLSNKFFRRDQIWFTQKDQYGISKLYSLAEFKIRNDASFEKDYLGGIYGGIPYLKDFEIGSEDNGEG
ncbi:AAA family ATPase [Thomasclavelia saccharogumia]|uniref:AAA family ATPase n=1 Tax=Thomasclavelia saccharogumia TaxID=341225 RepID=UPI000A535F1A|nr:ATP-binding protein [Thomasclavelia saccharogumia]